MLAVDSKVAKLPSGDQSVVPETVWTPTVVDMLEYSPTALGRNDSFPSRRRVRIASVDVAPKNSIRQSPECSTANEPSSIEAWSSSTWIYTVPPPQIDPEQPLETLGMDSMIYRPPYYSKRSDVPALPKTFAGRQFLLKGDSVEDLDEFEASQSKHVESPNVLFKRAYAWEYAEAPPDQIGVQKSIAEEDEAAFADSALMACQN